MRSVASTAFDDRLVSTGYWSRVDDVLHITRRQIADGIVKLKVIAKRYWQCIVRWGQFR
jgi:hypothetical protein